MDTLLSQLRATAEPTRLRLLALCARGAFCVTELCAVLGQSQPRLSRHLKLLTEAGLLERLPEGSNVYFQVPGQAELVRVILARLPEEEPVLQADRRQAARIAAERARAASDAFQREGMDWDELRALDLDAAAIEAALLAALPERIEALLDIGTGTGRLLEVLAPRTRRALGVDASREMLALARARLSERGLAESCTVRQADMYRLPLADRSFDAVTLQMVLHYAEDPAAALAEAARVLRPGGLLLVADLAPHGAAEVLTRFAHRWPGFDDSELAGWLGQAGCALAARHDIPGRLPVRVWRAEKLPADALTHA
jgi:ArsR family transcriptional regulator